MTATDKLIEESPGASLKQLREEQQLSIEEVSAQLHLKPHIIAALEADNFEQLPAATYVRGYLRSYAKLLKVSADTILDTYQDYAPELPEIIPEVKIKTQQTSSRDKPMLAFSYLIIFIFVLLLFAWWQSNFILDKSGFNNSESAGSGGSQLAYEITVVEHPATPFYRAPATQQPSKPNETATSTNQTHLSDTVKKSHTELPVDADTRVQQKSAASNAAEQSSNENNIDERGSGPDTVEISLHADSWVEVFDTNEKIYLNLARSGQTLQLHGTAPFNVLIGFSQGATVRFNGRDFDMAPFSRESIARFSLSN